jgi:C-terminal processing protease CtpA/Prc
MAGHGFLLSKDNDENIRIAFVYRSTRAYTNGVRRGWIIKKVNGTTANSNNINDLIGPGEIGINNNFEFIDNTGGTVSLSLIKEVVKITPVLHSEVISAAGTKIGYIVFQDFIDNAMPEIDSTFNAFKNEGVDELIVDLRYNGGGSVDVAVHLAGWILGKTNPDETLINFQHNEKNRDLDTTFTVPLNTNAFDFDRILFIGTGATASASELIINGMQPYMDVTLIGTPTDGKPVGMYVYVFNAYNYAVFPISFKYTNADKVGDFYDGLQPDILINDDVTRDFGDLDEEMLHAAVNYITSGGIPAITKKSTAGSRVILPGGSLSNFLRSF